MIAKFATASGNLRHRAGDVAVAALILMLGQIHVSAQLSGQPATRDTKRPQPDTRAPATDSKETPGTTNELRAVAAELKALREQQARLAAQELNRRQIPPLPGPPIYSNWVLVTVAALTALAAWRTLRAIEREVGANVQAAQAADKTAETLTVVERAALNLQTMRFDCGDASQPHLVTMGLKNSGRTTATVTEAIVILRIAATLPPVPSYHAAASDSCPPVFAAGEESNWRQRFPPGLIDSVPSNDRPARIWIYGRIRFSDLFGQRHEYGFGREFVPDDPALLAKPKQVRFAFPEVAAYNYAREIEA